MRISTVKLLLLGVTAAAALLPQLASAQLTDADLKRMRADKRVALFIGNGIYRQRRDHVVETQLVVLNPGADSRRRHLTHL